jgi:hypothetical protein
MSSKFLGRVQLHPPGDTLVASRRVGSTAHGHVNALRYERLSTSLGQGEVELVQRENSHSV